MTPNYRAGEPPRSKGSRPVQGGRGGNEVATAVNSEVSCLTEHHGANFWDNARCLMMCDMGSL